MNILNKKFTFKELFSSPQKMKEGSKIGKRFVETRDGTKIPVELLNKIAKKEFGYSNFYTLWRQDGNAGQTVVMKAYEEFKKSAKQRMKEGKIELKSEYEVRNVLGGDISNYEKDIVRLNKKGYTVSKEIYLSAQQMTEQP